MNQSLSDLRVIEMGENVSAPYCTKLLADLGANVVKIERPDTGDPLRSQGSFPLDPADASIGGLFRYLNTNKKSVALNPNAKNDADAILDLVAGGDLVIENLGVGVLEGYGLGFDMLKRANPHIALIRISDFGQSGPYAHIPATDLIVQASAGWVSNHMMLGQKPVQVGGRLSDFVAGVYAACAALTAWEMVNTGGKAVSLDISKQECLMSTLGVPWLHLENLRSLGWGLPEDRHFPFPGIVRCKDGLVGINALTAQHFADCCHLLDIPEYIPKQMEIVKGGPGYEAFFKSIEPWLMVRTVDEVVELCQAFRIPAAPISNGKKLTELAQLKARSFFVKDPEGKFIQPSFPYRMGTTPASLRRRAPQIGEHNSEILASRWGQEKHPSTKTTSLSGLPFEGIRVLDLGTFWAGPYVSCYLGSYGADVIKVESIQRPDAFRYNCAYPQEGSDWFEHSGIWQSTNLNKRDLTLNLSHSDGERILERLIEKADVIIENFSPRVMENFGLGVERLKQLNPDLIIMRMPGYGLEGPWHHYVSFAMPIEQACGMAWMTGMADGKPSNLGGNADAMIGMHAIVGLQAALHHRKRTGKSQFIEVAQIEAAACMTAEQVIAWSLTGKIQNRIGNRSSTMAPQGVYPCLDGEWVAISIRDDRDWREFMDMEEGVPEWAREPRFASFADRQQHHDDLDRLISVWTLESDVHSLVASLQKRGIPAARVLTTPHMQDDANLTARRFYQEIKHPRMGMRRYPRWPWLQSVAPREAHHRFGAPTLGQHNSEILGGELGFSQAEIGGLAKREVIGNSPKGLS